MKNQLHVHFVGDLDVIDVEAKTVEACFKKFLKAHPFDFIDFDAYSYFDGDRKLHFYLINWEDWI